MSNWVVPVELKKGQSDTAHVAKQLQAGAKICEQLISKSDIVNFQPVVATGSVEPKAQRKLNKKNLIRFHGKDFGFKRIRCGSQLANFLL